MTVWMVTQEEEPIDNVILVLRIVDGLGILVLTVDGYGSNEREQHWMEPSDSW
jgi:hypothetical protein